MTAEKIRNIESYYRSGMADLGRDFFAPCLSYCTLYRRAVGFFSSSSLVVWSSILPRLASPDEVRVMLLIGPYLSDDDRSALRRAVSLDEQQRLRYKISDTFIEHAIALDNHPQDKNFRLKLLTWMIANDRLEIRFAFPAHVEQPGLFHEKIGIFDYPTGDTIAFTGSANESAPAHSNNFESIDVYRSWIPSDSDRVANKIDQFEDAWKGHASGLMVIPLSEQMLNRVKSIAPDSCPKKPKSDPPTDDQDQSTRRWRHQDEAISCFMGSERGVLEMATGTGKTRTATRIVRELVDNRTVDSIIVAADGNDLLHQWYLELLQLAANLRPRFSILRHYKTFKETERFALDPKQRILLSSRYALPASLKSLTTHQASRTLLIHDEVHRLGSLGNRAALEGLSDPVRYRLGLSATPEREYDSDGTFFIKKHIGDVIYCFGLGDAIRRRILAPFNYFPLEYTPNQDDRDCRRQVYKKVAARRHEGRPMSEQEIWIELAKVYKLSSAKLPIFADFIDKRRELLRRCIIFVETMEYGEKVLRTVHRHRHDFHTYYASDDDSTLSDFASGKLECLITCHRLSEGIDIHSLQNVILFSSARARIETIQRIGRCLRTNPDDPDKRANIIDFIRQEPDPTANNSDLERKAWLEDLSRISPEE